MNRDVAELLVGGEATIKDAVAVIDRGEMGLALAVDGDGRLVATVTDGDVRRAMLAGIDLEEPISVLLARRPGAPLTAPVDTGASELLELMTEARLRHVPLIDENGRPAAVAFLDDFVEGNPLQLRALVMAGGFGTRLGELTKSLPKPMLPVGGRPLLERIIDQLRTAGVDRVHVATHYRPDEIVEHFRDGSSFGVRIDYLNEEEPLGTAGALGLMEHPDDRPVLVLNGDLVTDVDFRALLSFHTEHEAELTVGVWPYEVRVPYGLVQSDGEVVTRIEEKPLVRGFVNAGIYLLAPAICRSVPSGERLDMPELIERLLASGHRVVSFPLRESWLDIGEIEAYRRALVEAGAHAEQ